MRRRPRPSAPRRRSSTTTATAAQHRQHRGDAGGHDGLVDRRDRRRCWRSADGATPSTRAASDERPDQRRAGRPAIVGSTALDRTQARSPHRPAARRRRACRDCSPPRSPLTAAVWSPGRAIRSDAMRDAYHDQLDSIFDDLAGDLPAVEEAVATATEALLDADAELAEEVISADDADRPGHASGSRTALRPARPAAAGRQRPADGRRGAADGQPSWSGWATSPCTSPRSPGCASPTSPCPTELRPTIVADGRGRRGHGRQGRPDHRRARRRGRAWSSSPTTTRWTSCAAPASPSCSPTTGRTASRRPSTSRCSAATTSGIADHAVSVAHRVIYLVTGLSPRTLQVERR